MNWELIEKKLNYFYDNYAGKKCLSKTRNMDIVSKSARQAYFASVIETANPKRKGKDFSPSEDKLKAIIKDIIMPFLKKKEYDKANCEKTITMIRDAFKKDNEYPYTYGNAQKWLNMAYKYYIANLYHKSKLSAKVFFEKNKELLCYPFFAIDNIIESIITKELGVSFPDKKKWHERDCLTDFTDYWDNVLTKTKKEGYPPFLWELIKWDIN